MWFLEISGKLRTVANTSRLSQDGSGSYTGIFDVGKIGGDLTALVGHGGLATINEELKVAVANEDVRGGEGSSATSIVTGQQACWQGVSREGPSLVVSPLSYRRASSHQGRGEQS